MPNELVKALDVKCGWIGEESRNTNEIGKMLNGSKCMMQKSMFSNLNSKFSMIYTVGQGKSNSCNK